MLFDKLRARREILGSPQKNVITQLKRMLSVRQGSIIYEPNYGMPDLSIIYADVPASHHHFIYRLELLIKTYITDIQYIHIELEEVSCALGIIGLIIAITLSKHNQLTLYMRCDTHQMQLLECIT